MRYNLLFVFPPNVFNTLLLKGEVLFGFVSASVFLKGSFLKDCCFSIKIVVQKQKVG